MKRCISCGMPLASRSDHALDDSSKDYCKHCARPNGSMRSYGETLEAMTAWMVHTQGLDESVAREMVAATLAELPAWKPQKMEK